MAIIALLVGAFVVWLGLSMPELREISLLGLAFLGIGVILLHVARAVARPESPA